MSKEPIRIYVDTSVFGGVFDKEFAEPSRAFLRQASLGLFQMVTSVAVRNEVRNGPDRVRNVFRRFSRLMETVPVNEDALHVAMATVARCAAIVSWNFKHIVNMKKIPLYNAVNVLKGYGPLTIVSPLEVLYYEDQDEKEKEGV